MWLLRMDDDLLLSDLLLMVGRNSWKMSVKARAYYSMMISEEEKWRERIQELFFFVYVILWIHYYYCCWWIRMVRMVWDCDCLECIWRHVVLETLNGPWLHYSH